MSFTASRWADTKKQDHQTNLPVGFTLRSAALEDVENIAEMFNSCSRQMVGFDDTTVQELVNDFVTPNFDLDMNTRVVLDPQGKIVAYQGVFATNPVPVHPIVWGRVHPDYTGLGLGTTLLHWGVQRAHHVVDKVPVDARVAVLVHSIYNWGPAMKLFQDNGFSPARHFFQMRIEMDAPPPAPVWPDGITLETCPMPEGLEAYFKAFDEAFSDHYGHIEQPFEQAFEQWKYRRLKDEGLDPSLWFQAMDGDQIAGFSLGRKSHWESEDQGWVNLLGVRRPWRQRGLGLALLRHMFNVYWERGQRTVSLGVDADNLTGAVRLYENAGMHVHRQTTNFELELRPGVELTKTNSEE